MKRQIFDVVELKDNNKATILDVIDKKHYLAEIVNLHGETVDKRVIKENEILKVAHTRAMAR